MIPFSNVSMINKGSTPLVKFKGAYGLSTDIINSFSWANPSDINKYKTLHSSFKISRPVRQGNCGDCWAIATAQVFADRWAIEAKQVTPIFSHTLLLSCSIIPPTCGGGNICEAINYIATKGILKSNECWNYDWCSKVENCFNVNIPNINHLQIEASIPSCELDNKCVIFNEITKKLETKSSSLLSKRYKCRNWEDVSGSIDSYKSCKTFKLENNDTRENIINKIKEEIFLRGPVVSSFRLIPDHFKNNDNWFNKIYVYKEEENYCSREFESSSSLGGHSVSIVGWGRDSNFQLDYWVVRSTWGEINELNHEGGYFKMAISSCKEKINVTMGLDIPINVIEKYGTDERDIRYNTFGGVYAMLPLVDEEDYNKTLYKTIRNTKQGSKWMIILFVIILLLMIYYIIKK